MIDLKGERAGGEKSECKGPGVGSQRPGAEVAKTGVRGGEVIEVSGTIIRVSCSRTRSLHCKSSVRETTQSTSLFQR